MIGDFYTPTAIPPPPLADLQQDRHSSAQLCPSLQSSSTTERLQNSPIPTKKQERNQIGINFPFKIDSSILKVDWIYTPATLFSEIYFTCNEMETAGALIKVVKSWPTFYNNVYVLKHQNTFWSPKI